MTQMNHAFVPDFVSFGELAEARAGVARQKELIASLRPGSEHHRIATNALLLFQDGVFVMAEARALIRLARSRVKHSPKI